MFDPAIRELSADIKRHHSVLNNKYMPELLKTIPPMIMVLSQTRQIVYCNKSVDQFIGIDNEDEILGFRPGEALHCEKAEMSRHGCGGSVFCKFCGFNQALFEHESGKPAGKYECQLLTKSGEGVNLGISISPFEHQGHKYMFCVIENIENEKYRKMLESIFIHDLKNSLVSLNSLAGLMGHISPSEGNALMRAQLIRINEELENYEMLYQIEGGRLPTSQKEWVSLKHFVDEIEVSLRLNPDHRNKRVKKAVPDITIFCHKTLLRRVITNLVKNAFEAENERSEITVSVIVSTATISFKIRNPKVMSEQQQKMIFTRFSSSKGLGRGLGTYGAKKIVTGYLNGKISFISNPEKGTVFTVRIPKEIKEHN